MNVRKVMATGWFHTKIFLRGFVRTLGSTLVTGAAAGSVCGFTLITNETGYAAVGDFVASCALLAIALVGVYVAGQNGWYHKKDKGRFAKGVK